jgi:hypothetical protein
MAPQATKVTRQRVIRRIRYGSVWRWKTSPQRLVDLPSLLSSRWAAQRTAASTAAAAAVQG